MPHEWIISSLAVKPDGNQIAYLKNNGQDFLLYSRETSQGSLNPEKQSPLDLSHWNYRQDARLQPFKMAWRPNSSQIFLYTDWDWSAGYTFLGDIDTGQVCELNLNGWAILGRWSSDGRYLAVVRAKGHNLMYGTTELVVLDTVTGNLYAMPVVPKEAPPGSHYIGDIAWAPDNRHLLVIGEALAFPHCAPNCWEDKKLFLVDFLTSQEDDLFPSNQFISGNPGNNLAWSPDGSKVLAHCRIQKVRGLCFISVRKIGP